MTYINSRFVAALNLLNCNVDVSSSKGFQTNSGRLRKSLLI
nr:hypothetical protein YSBCXYJI_YSBCXYJI_CDS_0060 [Caudoviricetes sp.]